MPGKDLMIYVKMRAHHPSPPFPPHPLPPGGGKIEAKQNETGFTRRPDTSAGHLSHDLSNPELYK